MLALASRRRANQLSAPLSSSRTESAEPFLLVCDAGEQLELAVPLSRDAASRQTSQCQQREGDPQDDRWDKDSDSVGSRQPPIRAVSKAMDVAVSKAEVDRRSRRDRSDDDKSQVDPREAPHEVIVSRWRSYRAPGL